jgi:hypothetical protein
VCEKENLDFGAEREKRESEREKREESIWVFNWGTSSQLIHACHVQYRTYIPESRGDKI